MNQQRIGWQTQLRNTKQGQSKLIFRQVYKTKPIQAYPFEIGTPLPVYGSVAMLSSNPAHIAMH